MVIEYDKDYLRELYEDGKCKNKKHRFDTSVIKKYQKRIDTLMEQQELRTYLSSTH